MARIVSVFPPSVYRIIRYDTGFSLWNRGSLREFSDFAREYRRHVFSYYSRAQKKYRREPPGSLIDPREKYQIVTMEGAIYFFPDGLAGCASDGLAFCALGAGGVF